MTILNKIHDWGIRFRGTVAVLMAVVVLLLSSCVTTTSGGFNPPTSGTQALQDYIQLAVAYYDAGDMVRARSNIDNALAINSQSPDAYNILALIYQREGDTDLANEAFSTAIRFDRENSRARNNYAAFLFSIERFEEAYQQLEIVAADTTYDGRPVAFQNLGLSAARLGRDADAERAFERALQLNSNLSVAALELAQIRHNNGDTRGAKVMYNRYLTMREFLNLPHTPRSLWIGIQIEREFQNSDLLEGYERVLTTLYQDSPEYQLYRSLVDDN